MNFEVNKADLTTTRLVDSDPAELVSGEARLQVKRFGFSANNITYAVFGDLMGYWSFFPTEEGWGRVPVWGFAEVLDANGTGLADGELLFGYLPMGSELVVTPAEVGDKGFSDSSAHRSHLSPMYNGYVRCAADPAYDSATEEQQMLFWPLFMTDFVLDDWLHDNEWFDAETIVLSSASSKTAFGLAHLLSKRSDRPEIVGLTSPGNRDFVRGLGSYDRVLGYGDIGQLAGETPAVYVDMAGDAAVRLAVHTNMVGLTASVQVGGTHWTELAGDEPLPGPAPALFFAPDQIIKRRQDWGPGGVEQRFAEAWTGFLPTMTNAVAMVERSGIEAAAETYLEVLEGRADPRHAFVLSMN
ncbi:MAG: DUF2855 family protein [Acidimicrobiales bacterium]